MSKPLKKLLRKTRRQVQQLRDKVNKLKKEQVKKQREAFEEIEDIKPPKTKTPDRVLVEFSMASVAKATLVVIGLFLLAQFLGEIKEILILVFVALFLSAALDSIVDTWEQKWKIPRAVSVLLIYLIFFLALAILISTLIPLVATQVLELAQTVRDLIGNLTAEENKFWELPYTETLREMLIDFMNSIDQETITNNLQATLSEFGSQLQNLAGNTWDTIKTIFNGVFNAIIILVLTFFMVVDEKGIEQFLLSLFSSKHAKYIIAKSDAVKENIGYWLRGQLKLMVAMAIITFIGLKLLGVDYAVTLALLAGITELIPVVGPIIAMVPALLIGLNVSLAKTFWIFALYIVIQQLEGNILVPLIMQKAVGLSPIIIVIVMLIGYSFMGVLGVIISVPVATAISIFIKDYTAKAK